MGIISPVDWFESKCCTSVNNQWECFSVGVLVLECVYM
uniref:Uncharacterized protein n=1 Tax=Anguilla anguilla TaxID=7936 RepID=A0A0E9VA75_ANGAN